MPNRLITECKQIADTKQSQVHIQTKRDYLVRIYEKIQSSQRVLQRNTSHNLEKIINFVKAILSWQCSALLKSGALETGNMVSETESGKDSQVQTKGQL